MDVKRERLRECPFCGCRDIKVFQPWRVENRAFVKCSGCGAKITRETEEEAVYAWNRRRSNGRS